MVIGMTGFLVGGGVVIAASVAIAFLVLRIKSLKESVEKAELERDLEKDARRDAEDQSRTIAQELRETKERYRNHVGGLKGRITDLRDDLEACKDPGEVRRRLDELGRMANERKRSPTS